MSFWPNDIFAADNLSPREIMGRAGDELATRTKVLSFDLRETRLSDRVVIAFVVKNTAYSLEYNIFEASHRINQSYPVLIDPPVSNIPEFLTRERRIAGTPGISVSSALNFSILGGTPGRTVTNEWVCGTPAEFREKLAKLLAFDHVKSSILSLLAPTHSGEPPRVDSDVQEMPPPGDETGDKAIDEPESDTP